MGSTYQLFLNGVPADADLLTALSSLEVEETLDQPGAAQFSLPVARSDAGDLTYVSESRFQPLAAVAVVVTPPPVTGLGMIAAALGGGGSNGGTASGPQCIFDGFILSQKLHLETGNLKSKMEVWAQDASWLMNLQERTKEWIDLTDADVADAIFSEYGITPAGDNAEDDSSAHTEAGHTLMQRGSDMQFLRNLARRNGKLCRVSCADQPSKRIGYFARPKLDGDPSAVLVINDLENWNVHALDLSWDATLPNAVIARQVLFSDNDEDGASADTSDSGLKPLGERGLADFRGKAMSVLLAAPVDDAGELAQRARSLLREAGWFARCEGETDVARLGIVLRAGTIVRVDGIGSLHSGPYLVWSVRHTITAEAHKMKFVLVRNAVGPAGAP